MHGKKIAALALAGTMAFMLSACGQSGIEYGGGDGDFETESVLSESESAASSVESGTETETDSDTESAESAPVTMEGKKVGIALPSKEQTRWLKDAAALTERFKAKGAETEVQFAENDAASQVSQIRAMIAAKVDLLVITPVDSSALSDVLAEAKAAGIPVIDYDRLIENTSDIGCFVTFDNYKIGEMQAEYVIDQLGIDKSSDDTFHIEFFSGDENDRNSFYLFRGAYDEFIDAIYSKKVIVSSGKTTLTATDTEDWSEAAAEKRMETILKTYYSDGTKLDAVICADDTIALGVMKALDADYDGDVIVTGQDADDANLAKIVDGKQAMTVFKAFGNEAAAAAEAGSWLVSGKTPDKSLVDGAGWSFDCAYDDETYNNGTMTVPSLILTPVSITAKNIQKELVDTGYYTMEGDYPVSVN
jgi:putative multiple sugar transport system substrate-binding protein